MGIQLCITNEKKSMSSSTIGTLEKGVKYVQSEQWKHQSDVNDL